MVIIWLTCSWTKFSCQNKISVKFKKFQKNTLGIESSNVKDLFKKWLISIKKFHHKFCHLSQGSFILKQHDIQTQHHLTFWNFHHYIFFHNHLKYLKLPGMNCNVVNRRLKNFSHPTEKNFQLFPPTHDFPINHQS